jgi:mannose-1-phosphate guanylyltransferase
MKALLLAAGFGTRLRPLTNQMPKCLVPVNGVPLLGIWLSRLTRVGCGPFLINTHFLHEQVEDFIARSPERTQVTLCYEPALLGTAATLIANRGFFEDQDGMLIHADNYCLADFEEFMEAHRRRPDGCLLTMMTFRSDDPSSCGIVTTNDLGVMVGFEEKPLKPSGNLANGAVYILSRQLIGQLGGQIPECRDFSTDLLPKLIAKTYCYETHAPLIDIGSPQSYAKANGF